MSLDQGLYSIPIEELQSALRNMRRSLEKQSSPSLVLSQLDKQEGLIQKLRTRIQDQGMHAMERFLVDYCLRNGCIETAKQMAEWGSLREHVDITPFEKANGIIASLNAQKTAHCLAWCQENKPALKKLKLRRMECMILGGEGKQAEALAHAQKYLSPWAAERFTEIQKCMAAIVLPQRLAGFWKQDPWKALVEDFREAFLGLYSLPAQPSLVTALHSGLSALKSPACYTPANQSPHCPVCIPIYGEMAKSVLFAHHMQSIIVCRISGRVMDEDNPPMVLPNGNAYSFLALTEMAAVQKGNVTDPRTGQVFALTDAKKAFLA